MNKELWYFLIDGQEDDETGIVGNFYAYGQHLGDALGKAIKASAEYHFNNCNVTEASLLEKFEVIGDYKELVEIADNVFMRPTTFTFSLNDPDKEFIPPVGIVKGVDAGEYEYDLIQENFVAYSKNENGIFEFELVLTKSNLIDTFLKIIDFLQTVDGFWIYIKNFWENKETELWVAKHFTDKKTVIEFLKSHRPDTLENGYIEIVVHSILGKTNLVLGEHKKIQLYTEGESVFNNFIGQIIELGFEQTRDFYNLEFGYQHWHYRPADSLSRSKLREMLTREKFELIHEFAE